MGAELSVTDSRILIGFGGNNLKKTFFFFLTHFVYIHYRSKVWGHPGNLVFSMKTLTSKTVFSCANIIAKGFSRVF